MSGEARAVAQAFQRGEARDGGAHVELILALVDEAMAAHPIMLLWPCLFLSVTIFALNFVGDGLRALLDPRNR